MWVGACVAGSARGWWYEHFSYGTRAPFAERVVSARMSGFVFSKLSKREISVSSNRMLPELGG